MIPETYNWIEGVGILPKMIVEAFKLYGVKESIGSEDNPEILGWAKELDLDNYIHDSIAWCGLFMAIVAKRAGKEVVKDPLWAANWSHWGDPVKIPMLGDVLVFKRPGGNHVALYLGEDKECYFVLGGNQSDKVGIVRIYKTRLIAARRNYKVGPPESVKRYFLNWTGEQIGSSLS